MTFAEALKSPREEHVHHYLIHHPELLFLTFGRGIYYKALIPKFRFGTEYVSDFVLIELGSVTCCSPWISIALIELEPPTETAFAKSGVYGKRLNSAIAQITDWLSWIRTNDSYFRASLTAAVQSERAVLSQRFDSKELVRNLSNNGGIFIPETTNRGWRGEEFSRAVFVVNGKIIIGRRAMFSKDDDRRRATLFAEMEQKIEIIPYDRLLDAENCLHRGIQGE